MIVNTLSEYLGITSTVLVLLIMLIWIAGTHSKTHLLPPSPPALPIIGNMLHLKSGKLELAFQELRAKYGDVFSFKLGTKHFVVVNGHEAILDLFVKKGEYVSDRPSNYFSEQVIYGEGIFFASGHTAKQHRAFALNALRGTSFGKTMESIVMEEVECALRMIDKYDGQSFNPKHLIKFSAANVILSIMLGRRFDHNDTDLSQLVDFADNFFRSSNTVFVSSAFPILQYVPVDLFGIKEMVKCFRGIRSYMQQQIDYHRRSYDYNITRDYIDMFLREMERQSRVGSGFTYSQLATSLFDLFIAGSDTVSSGLLWGVVFLVNNSKVQDKMRKELDDVVGFSRLPSLSDKQNLPYSQAVVTEILRRGCVSPLSFPHAPSCDVKFRGYDIPKGTQILMNLSSVMFDANEFREPLRFDPSRFLDSDGNLYGTEKVIAFSVGKRICVGESVARAESFLLLTSLVQRFELLPEITDRLLPTEPQEGFTRSPKPFLFRAVKRV